MLLGLQGEAPDTVDPAAHRRDTWQHPRTRTLRSAGSFPSLRRVDRPSLAPRSDVPAERPSATSHPNGMRFTALDARQHACAAGLLLRRRGLHPFRGGARARPAGEGCHPAPVPYPFSSAAQLLAARRVAPPHHRAAGAGERVRAARAGRHAIKAKRGREPGQASICAASSRFWAAMQHCIERGIVTEGILPGGLNVRRRAPRLHQRIQELDSTANPATRSPRSTGCRCSPSR